ncbi:hypothetical protein Tco_1447500 [Tanacetum coccineum]
MGEGSSMPTNPYHTPIIQPSTSQPQNKQSRRKQRKDTKISQSSGPTEPIADKTANEDNVPTQSNDPPLLRITKIAQAKEITSLKKIVKKLERKRKSKTLGMKRSFKIGRSAQVVSSEDEGLGDQEDASKQRRKIDDIDKDADTAEVSVAATITTKEITLAQALAELRSAKPKVVVQDPVQSTTTIAPSTISKAKSITFRYPDESTTRTTLTPIPSNIKDKGKDKMIKPEKPLKKTEQIRLDEEFAFKLQAKEEKQAKLAREKAEEVEKANISWDNVQAMIEADRLLPERLQAREQEELTDKEKARLFVELLEKRKKHFAVLRAQEKRNKQPTKAQKKSTVSTYLKHMAGGTGYLPKDKNKATNDKTKHEMEEREKDKVKSKPKYKRRCCSLILAESDSLPHAHTQATKTYYKHQDSRIKKAQVLKTKTSANSDIKDSSSKTKLRGRLLESFQEDAKYEHVGQDTRSQGGKDDQD